LPMPLAHDALRSELREHRDRHRELRIVQSRVRERRDLSDGIVHGLCDVRRRRSPLQRDVSELRHRSAELRWVRTDLPDYGTDLSHGPLRRGRLTIRFLASPPRDGRFA
jgi:hypothetical protein